MRRIHPLVCLLIGLLPVTAWSRVTLPAVFADHMVLQQKTRIKIWGWADPWETAVVSVSWSDQEFKIKGDANASWHFYIDTPAAGGPYTLSVKSEESTFTLQNIMIGEVWICAGQSNMEWSAKHGVKDAMEALPLARNNRIRLFEMQKKGTPERQTDVTGSWSVCDSASLRSFSAVGYFFGKNLEQQLNTPIGLIDMAWGGSYIESWIPEALVELYPDTRRSARLIPPSNHWPQLPGYIYNGMVAPVMEFRTAGIIWYQGESNTHYPPAYHLLQNIMIENWRRESQVPLPFYYVQIAPFVYQNDSTGLKAAFLREMQQKTLEMPGTGMVVTTDLVDDTLNVHPSYKSEVGRRLARMALSGHYGQSTDSHKSPSPDGMEIRENKIIITLKDVSEKGLEFRNSEVNELEISGTDRNFRKAKARIAGGNRLEVWSDQVSNPVAVRFAFRNAPAPTLFDKSGLPVAPFRTDDWE